MEKKEKEKKQVVARSPYLVGATLTKEDFESVEERAERERLPMRIMINRLIILGMKYDDQLQEKIKEALAAPATIESVY